ncbi:MULTISPECIES: hypothetical protein [unclassified Pseudomonas]|uniref:hypothetical protein n=1 Tax=unclassified Pseudomonas TaxID=196821 RepID=UPI000A1EDAC2|nr:MULTISPECIES: hypothetical protein [unclassified Pseudomonas]
MSNSLEVLLEKMRKESVTLGWGAVAAYSRAQLNRLLEQQYLQRLAQNNFLPPFSDILKRKAAGQTVSVTGLEFGTPLLSFSNASVSNSKATLTMNIIAGTLTFNGELLRSYVITEAQGHSLSMEVDLETVRGEVAPYGRVALNLARGAEFTSDLFDDEDKDYLHQQLDKALGAWLGGMPARCVMFELGTVDFEGYDELTPTHFILRTQAAPGARIRNADNYGDGAVLVLMRLRGNASDGQQPDEAYPYLIPDGDYSATLVLNKDLLGYASEEGFELLATLLFPELNAFVKTADHTPLDRALFGNINPLLMSLKVKPAMGVVVPAGKTQQFVLHDGEDKVLKASAWSALNPHSHDDKGHGTITANGLYTAPAEDEVGEDVQTVIVTAEFKKGNDIYKAAARLLVTSAQVLPMPVVGAYQPTQSASGVDVWNAGNDPVRFRLLGQPLGELAYVGGGRSRFVPGRQAHRRVMSVQELQAQSAEQNRTALVLVHNQPLLALEPPFVPKHAFGGTTQLREVNRIMPNEKRRWRMLSGPGDVTQSGQFTASTQRIQQPNVVACEVVRNGVVFASGYSVLKETPVQPLSSWVELQSFSITVGKSPEGVRGIVGSSGFQQLEIEITVETMQVDRKDYKLNPAEMATITLFDRAGQKIASLCDNEEGIGSGYGNVWRTSLRPNRFILANEGSMQPVTPRGPEERTIRQTLYLHRRGTSGSQVFYAGFQSASGRWFYSNATAHRNATIEVQVRTPEPFKSSDYTLIRKRVDGGGGNLGGADPEHDDFDLHPVTEDYWLLDYKNGTFYTAEFVEANANADGGYLNTSLARWESPYLNERFHSYTGWIFQNHGDPEPRVVSFDKLIKDVLGSEDYQRPVRSQYEAGLLVIANYRNMNRKLREVDSTALSKLTKPLRVQLRDAQGNVHVVQLDYLPSATIGDRNVLVHSVPSRPTAGDDSIIRLVNFNAGKSV